MELNARQKEAVEYLEGPLLVLAGPGTGKTQLLSKKVAYILQNTDASPENILCMTFTDSGAINMRERLKSIIGKDGLKVTIGTYHAFGSDILARYKNYSENFNRNLDSSIDEVTQFKIVKNIQSELDGRDILRSDKIKDIISVISKAKSAGLSALDLQKIAEKNIEDSRVLSEAISPLLQNVVPRNLPESYKNAYAPINEILKDYENTEEILKGVGRSIGNLARDLKEAIAESQATNKLPPLTNWKDNYFEKDDRGNYRLKDRVANKKLLSIANVMARYDEYLKTNGLFDFDDMIQEALRILRTDKGFKATLTERYQFIMLDEFQDTNPSQFAIIKELTDYEKPLVMAVGDDDQAIYEFQGALSTNLADFRDYYQAKVIPLTENYRSTQEILDFSRRIIDQAPDRFVNGKELTAHKEAPDSTQIYRHEFLSSDMEYSFIAEEIARLIEYGVSQSQIAIISYRTRYFAPILPYLKAYPNIKIAYEKRDDLFEDEKMHEIFEMARFVYELANNKRATAPLIEIFTYSCLNLPKLEMLLIAAKAKREKKSIFEIMSAHENADIKGVVEWFAELAVKSFNQPVEMILNEFANKFENVKMSDYERFHFYENLASLRGKIAKHFGGKTLKLADLIEMLDDYKIADMALNTASPYKDADEAVQILTAHKAKGLEFEYVFMVSADHTAWGKGKGNNNMLALPKNVAHIRHTGTTDGEKLRVIYVTLTRAKHTLYITNSLHDFLGKSPERLEYFGEYMDDDKVISPLIPNGKVIQHYEVSDEKVAQDSVKKWLMPYIKPTPEMRALYQTRVDNWRMSASSLTSFIDLAYGGPEEFFKSRILQAPQEPETESLAMGDLMHKTFEAITNQNLSSEQAENFFLTELEKKELPVEIAQKIRESGPKSLLISLNKFDKILRNGKAEVDFSAEKISIDGVPVTGKIDHILIDEQNKTIEIFDFKTGNYHNKNWRSHGTLYKYMLQLGFYKLLLNNSPIYKNYKIEKAHILFVKPDKDEEVHDKIYEFNKEDEQELLALIKAVYKVVHTLEFIEDPELFVAKDDSLGLKDIKEFVALLLAKNEEIR